MAWNPADRLNPELLRGLRTTLPRRRALFVAGLTLALLSAGAWVVWNVSAPYTYDINPDGPDRAAAYHALRVERSGATAYGVLTVALFGLLFMLGPAMAGLSFVQERLRGTAIFQQMTLLSPRALAWGKFWGAGALAYFVALMLLPCALAAAWLGGQSPEKVARLYLFLFVGGFAWQAVGLYASAALSGPSERAMRGGLLAGPLVAVAGAVAAVALNQFFTADYEAMAGWLANPAAHDYGDYQYRSYQSFWWHFYGARVPAYAVVLGLLGFTGAWAFAGTVRRVKVWQLIPTGPRAAWLFHLTSAAVLVGLLWGRHVDDTEPAARLQVYMALAWAAVALLAGGSALTRDRLREWWSADRDPLAVLQRSEIKASAATLLVAGGVSLAGLCALWASYHVTPGGAWADLRFFSQLVPIAACFALTLVATVAFVQLCAMFRFRIGGWAGVALLAGVYVFAGVAGVVFGGRRDNPAALLNPLFYAEAVTRGDYYMDSSYDSAYMEGPRGEWHDRHGVRAREAVVLPTDYTPSLHPPRESAAAGRGLAVESAFALLCLVLAGLKLKRTRLDLLRAPDA